MGMRKFTSFVKVGLHLLVVRSHIFARLVNDAGRTVLNKAQFNPM